MTTDTGTDDPAAAQTDTGGRRHRSAYSQDRSKTVVGRVVAVHTGPPRTISWRGREVTTGIFKEAVAGRVRATGTNLCGDGQADLVNHGGTNKAVNAYPHEHYPYWRSQLGAMPAFSHHIDDAQIADLVAYLRARFAAFSRFFAYGIGTSA